jgi:MFS family permease
VSQSITVLIVGRAMTGIGAAGVLTESYCIFAFAFPPVRPPASTGIRAAIYDIASVLGPIFQRTFTDLSVT